MTSSSINPGIIEHVGRAIADADMEDYMEFHHLHDARACAAIRATLQYARDNVSERMRHKGSAAYWGEKGFDKYAPTFRAMLDALLQEIGGGE